MATLPAPSLRSRPGGPKVDGLPLHAGPMRPVVMQHRSVLPQGGHVAIANGVHIASRASPHPLKIGGGSAVLLGPTRAVVMQDCPATANRKHVIRCTAPD